MLTTPTSRACLLYTSTRAAVEEGVVAGGGTIFVNVIPAVEALLDKVEGDEKTGVQIIACLLYTSRCV